MAIGRASRRRAVDYLAVRDNDDNSIELDSDGTQRKSDMGLYFHHFCKTGVASKEKWDQATAVFMNWKEKDARRRQHAHRQIKNHSINNSLDVFNYLNTVDWNTIIASPEPEEDMANTEPLSTGSPLVFETPNDQGCIRAHKGAISESDNDERALTGVDEDCDRARPSTERQRRRQTGGIRRGATQRPQSTSNAGRVSKRTNKAEAKAKKTANHLPLAKMTTYNRPIPYSKVLGDDGIPHSYILSNVLSERFCIIACFQCNLYFGRDHKDILKGARTHVRTETHDKNVVVGSQPRFISEKAPPYFSAVWEIGYPVEDCTIQQAIENNVIFLCCYTKLTLNDITKEILEEFRGRMSDEDLSRVKEIYTRFEHKRARGRRVAPKRLQQREDETAQNEILSANENLQQSAPRMGSHEPTPEAQLPAAQRDPFHGYSSKYSASLTAPSSPLTRPFEAVMPLSPQKPMERMVTVHSETDNEDFQRNAQFVDPSELHRQLSRAGQHISTYADSRVSESRIDPLLRNRSVAPVPEPTSNRTDSRAMQVYGRVEDQPTSRLPEAAM